MANTPTEIENLSDELSSNIQPPSLDEIRDLRMAYYQNSSLVPPTHDYTVNCNSPAIASHNDNMVHLLSHQVTVIAQSIFFRKTLVQYLVPFKMLTQQEIKMKMQHHNYVHLKSIVLVFVLI